jgi:hypothetical protein
MVIYFEFHALLFLNRILKENKESDGICHLSKMESSKLINYSSNMCQSRPNENLAGGKVGWALYYGI